MASVNKIHLIGNVGKDPEVRYSSSGKAVANLTLATSFKKKGQNGETIDVVDWHRLSFFDKLAEIVGEYVKKGALIYVEGSVKYGKFVNKDGIEVQTTTINCHEMTLLRRPEVKEQKPKYEGLPMDDEDIPF